MPPKVRISREQVIEAGIAVIKNGEALNARNIVALLNCSTQPIFSNFSNMDELKTDILKKCNEMYHEYVKNEMEKGDFPPYKAMGMAYISFAGQEKELFRLLYMRDRNNESFVDDLENDKIVSLIQKNVGISCENAKLFHLEMWAFVHGIATMHATGYLQLDRSLISRMLTDNFQGLKKQFAETEKSWI